MTTKKIIDGLYFTVGMMLFNPATGEAKTPDELNEDDRYTYDACMGAIELLKAHEPIEARLNLCESCTKEYAECEADKTDLVYGSGVGNDNIIGCPWYMNRWKAQELCEDAVSRKYLLGQSYSIKFQTIDESDEEAYREKVVCVEDIENAPSVQPVPVARVMTLEEWKNLPEPKDGECLCYEINSSGRLQAMIVKVFAGSENLYGKAFRCWTSRPTDEQREATGWNERSVQ